MEKGKDKSGIGFQHAFYGVVSAVKTGKNIRFHLIAALLVILVSCCLKTTVTENLVIAFCIGFVIFAEMVNSAIEFVVDLVCQDILKGHLKQQEYHEKAKLAKDIAAGAVLVAALTAVVAGVLIFFPKII